MVVIENVRRIISERGTIVGGEYECVALLLYIIKILSRENVHFPFCAYNENSVCIIDRGLGKERIAQSQHEN